MRINQHNTPDITIFHSVAPPEKRQWHEHHHAECELSVVLNGSGIYSVRDRTYDFRSGDVFLFGSDEEHLITEITSDNGEWLDLLNVHFNPRLLWANVDTSTLPLIKLFSDRSDLFSNRIDRTNPNTDGIRRNILDMEQEISNRKACYELKLKMTLYSILICMLREYRYTEEHVNIQLNDHIRSQLFAALNYIDSNLSENLTLEDIAKKAAMSKTYFSTLFKRYNGISPWSYIRIKRVEKAITLLTNSDLTKIEISEKCGFNSVANFYKAFKQVTDKTPSEYSR